MNRAFVAVAATGVRRCLALPLALALFLLASPPLSAPHRADAAPEAQGFEQVCQNVADTLPEGGTLTSGSFAEGTGLWCTWTRGVMHESNVVTLKWFSDLAKAQEGFRQASGYQMGRVVLDTPLQVGEERIQGWDAASEWLVFRRGCWLVSVGSGVSNRGDRYFVETAANQADIELKQAPPCPPVAEPAEQQGELDLNCSYGDPGSSSPGVVTCRAEAKGFAGGDPASYEWSLDQVRQPEAGADFRRGPEQLSDGEHVLTVEAVWGIVRTPPTQYAFTVLSLPADGQAELVVGGTAQTLPLGEPVEVTVSTRTPAIVRVWCNRRAIELLTLSRGSGGVTQERTAVLFLRVQADCAKLFPSGVPLLAMAGAVPATLRSQAAERGASVEIDLREGLLHIETANETVAVAVQTATARVTTSGVGRCEVTFDAQAQTTTVSAESGDVHVQPANGTLAPIALSSGQQVSVRADSVGAVIPIKSSLGGLASGALVGVAAALLAGAGAVMLGRRRRRTAGARPPSVAPTPKPAAVPPGKIPSQAPARGLLVVLEGPAQRPSLPLTGGVLVLGRNRSCALVLDDPAVSSNHASLAWFGGAWVLSDASTNGTFVNGVRIQRQALRPGDVIQIGSVRLVFRQ